MTPGAPTPFPTTAQDVVMGATVRACMSALPDTAAAAASRLDACLNQGEGGFIVAGVAGEVPAVLMEVASHPGQCRAFAFIAWRAGGAWGLQAVTALLPDPVEDRLLGAVTTRGAGRPDPASFAREGSDGGTPLLAVLAVANACGSGPRAEPLLFALQAGSWRLAWDGRDSVLTSLSDSSAEFAAAGGIDALRVRGALWSPPDDPAGRIFAESHAGPHRLVDLVWTRAGQRYLLTATAVQPSAYNTLVRFIYRLSIGDDAGAAALATDRTLTAAARALGLVQQPVGLEWQVRLEASTACCGPIHILSGRSGPRQPVVVTFAQRGGDWLIAAIAADTPR